MTRFTASLPSLERTIHVVGIAGVGMNAIAQVLRHQGYTVTGSDRGHDQGQDLPVLQKLAAAGITMLPQDGSGICESTGALVVSSAIESDNPDLIRARAQKIPVLHRAEALAMAAAGKTVVAIAGTSGKTTVTGMVGWLLEQAGLDPTVINGGALVNWRSDQVIGNVRVGQGHYWVIEVDESDRSLLHFHPEWAALTNISRDHFSLEETIKLFQQFAAQVGVGICCGAGVSSLLRSSKTVVEAVDPAVVRPSLRLIGEHNAHNAALAVTLCEALGVERQVALDALSDFRGIERRLEQVGAAQGVQVFDDYGHNTAKIAAACRAVSASIAGNLLAVWRPHGYGPLAAMADDLAEMFKQVLRPDDRLYVLPVYYAGGTANRQLESSDWVCRLQAAGIAAEHVLDYPALEKAILDRVREGDAVLCMGARDPELPFFARHLVQRLATV